MFVSREYNVQRIRLNNELIYKYVCKSYKVRLVILICVLCEGNICHRKMSSKKLVRVSKDVVKKTGKHCLVLTLNDEGTALEGAGDGVWVTLLQERPDLM